MVLKVFILLQDLSAGNDCIVMKYELSSAPRLTVHIESALIFLRAIGCLSYRYLNVETKMRRESHYSFRGNNTLFMRKIAYI